MPQCDCKAPSVMNLISFGRTRHWMHVACTVNRDRWLFVCMLLPLWCRDIRQSIHHTTKRPVGFLFFVFFFLGGTNILLYICSFVSFWAVPTFYAAFWLVVKEDHIMIWLPWMQVWGTCALASLFRPQIYFCHQSQPRVVQRLRASDICAPDQWRPLFPEACGGLCG